MVMQPPPAADYPPLSALLEARQAHAAAEGYAIVRSRSKAGYKSGVVAKVDIVCERNGEPRRKLEARRRKTASIKCGCPFRVNAIYKQSFNVWTTDVRNAEHNHEDDEVPDASAAARKPDKTAEVLAHIDAATKSG